MAVLKTNGTPGQLELTFVSKVAAVVLASLLVAAAGGAVSSALQLNTLTEKVEALEAQQAKTAGNVDMLRDRVATIEGQHSGGTP